MFRRAAVAVLLFLLGATPVVGMTVDVGRAEIALAGPWRFAPGDDTNRAAPDFDDGRWETVDLTPEPGAHDADVGLRDYVPGWWTRGHRGYAGYAWYRLRVDVSAPRGTRLALLAPAFVEDAFQVFWNGRLLGGSGDFATEPPAVYGAQPMLFALPDDAANGEAVVAIRVWMRPGAEREPDAGGIHIAPRLGDAAVIALRHESQWRQTILGYIVDVVEPAAFVLLALIALATARYVQDTSFHRRLALALLLTAALRANQAVYFWTSVESSAAFEIVKYTLLEPLVVAAWLATWHARFSAERLRWAPAVVAAVTVATMLVTLIDAAPDVVRTALRASLALVLAYVVATASPRRVPDYGLSVAAVVLVAIGVYAEELWTLGVPGIWFPFGVGVSRTQYAYAALIVVLGVLAFRALARRPVNPGADP